MRPLLSCFALLAPLVGCALAPYGASVNGGAGYVDARRADGSYSLSLLGLEQSAAGAWADRSRERQLRQNLFRRAEELCGDARYTLNDLRQTMVPSKSKAGYVVRSLSAQVVCSH